MKFFEYISTLFLKGIPTRKGVQPVVLVDEQGETYTASGGGGGGGSVTVTNADFPLPDVQASLLAKEAKQDTLIARIEALENELIAKKFLARISNSFHPDPRDFLLTDTAELILDSSGAVRSRSETFTDAGSFRWDMSGTSMTTALTGLFNFDSTDTVTGVGTAFFSELKIGDYIKVTTDLNTSWRQIVEIKSNTELILDRDYSGTATGVSAHKSYVSFNLGTGASVSLNNSFCTLSLGTSASVSSRVSRTVDYPAVVGSSNIRVTQRIANQDIYIGFSQQSTATARYFAWFRLNGTLANTLIAESCGIEEGTPTPQDIESTIITLPENLQTSADLLYRIEVKDQRVRFFINDKQVAEHKRHIPQNYDVLGWGVVGVHGSTPPASNTDIVIDYYNVNNANEVAIYNPSLREGFLAERVPMVEKIVNQPGAIAINTDLAVLDCTNLGAVVVHVVSLGTGGVVTPQWSDDPTLVNRQTATMTDQTGAESTTFNTASIRRIANVQGRYFILRLTSAVTANQTLIYVNGTQMPINLLKATQVVSISGTPAISISSAAPTLYTDTSTNLGAGATFTGTSRDSGSTASMQTFVANVFADQAGAFRIEKSADNITWRRACNDVTYSANEAKEYSIRVTTRYNRVILVNGGIAQGQVLLTSAYHKI